MEASTLSSTDLKAVLLTLRDHSKGISRTLFPVHLTQRIHSKDILRTFFPDNLSLTDEVSMSREGILFIRKKGEKRVREYTIEKFFIHHKLDKKEIGEALRRVNDLLLIIKLEKEELTARDIIGCRNAEIRRFLFQRYGHERFVKELNTRLIHKDGENELLLIPWRKDEEPITLVKVKDSTTGKVYLLRVPPSMRTCREAVAWTFGMATEEYEPEKET
jgi:hypothetical protein